MNVLVTAGNTQAPIDEVRCITNIFSGRTGASIALVAAGRGHRVTLLTSQPEAVSQLVAAAGIASDRLQVVTYRTYDDLRSEMEKQLRQGHFEAVIHAAAVSDFAVAGAYIPSPGSRFEPASGHWSPAATLQNAESGKITSQHTELWLRLTPTLKIVDQLRSTWGFAGLLVKFKLEVGLNETQLAAVAERSRCQSQADLMVANTLEGKDVWALLGPVHGAYQKIERRDLGERLLIALEDRAGH